MFGGTRGHPAAELTVDPVQVLDELPDVVSVVDVTGLIEFVTDSCERVLGVPAAELVGRHVCEFLDADGRRNCLAWMAYARQGIELPELAHHVIRADKTLARFETRIRMLPGSDGTPKVVAVSRDVSARSELEQQAVERTQTWADVVDLIQEGVVVLDEEGVVVAANRAASDLLHADLAELRGAPINRFATTANEDSGEPCSLSGGVVRVGRSRDVSVAPRRQGRSRPLHGRITCLAVAHGGGPQSRVVLVLEEPGRSASAHAEAHVRAIESLSPREISVLRLLAEGRDVRAIAAELGLSVHTVRAYVKSILRKLDVRTQLQAVIASARAGVLDLS